MLSVIISLYPHSEYNEMISSNDFMEVNYLAAQTETFLPAVTVKVACKQIKYPFSLRSY